MQIYLMSLVTFS